MSSPRIKWALIILAVALISICLPVVLSYRSSRDFQSILLPNRPSRDLGTITKDINAREAREEPAAQAAVRQYGTNLLPELLSLLVSRDSSVQQVIARTPIVGAYIRTEMDKHEFAMDGFKALGQRAAPAIPQLAHLLTDSAICGDAALCLVFIGPRSIPVLTAAATNADANVRTVAVMSLGSLGSNSLGNAEVIIDRLHDESPVVREMAARSLGQIGANPDLVIPKLLPLLSDPSSFARCGAVSGIGDFGPQAQGVRKALVPLLNDPDERVRILTHMALAKIVRTNDPR